MLVPEIARLRTETYGVHGLRKMHALMSPCAREAGRDQIARLMRIARVIGLKRSEKVFMTKSDPAAGNPADLVKWHFATAVA